MHERFNFHVIVNLHANFIVITHFPTFAAEDGLAVSSCNAVPLFLIFFVTWFCKVYLVNDVPSNHPVSCFCFSLKKQGPFSEHPYIFSAKSNFHIIQRLNLKEIELLEDDNLSYQIASQSHLRFFYHSIKKCCLAVSRTLIFMTKLL